MKNPLLNITHCSFKCNDYEKMLSFYRDTLELKQMFTLRNEDGSPWLAYLKVVDAEYIELFNTKYEGQNEFDTHGHHHLCLMVDDIFEAARTLESKGVLLTRGPASLLKYYRTPYGETFENGKCGSLAFYIQDPEGNEIEIMQYTRTSLQMLNDHY